MHSMLHRKRRKNITRSCCSIRSAHRYFVFRSFISNFHIFIYRRCSSRQRLEYGRRPSLSREKKGHHKSSKCMISLRSAIDLTSHVSHIHLFVFHRLDLISVSACDRVNVQTDKCPRLFPVHMSHRRSPLYILTHVCTS